MFCSTWLMSLKSCDVSTVVSSPPSAILSFEGSKPDHTKNWLYGLCSLSYLGAMVSSNSALQYVNYPTQVRSCSVPTNCVSQPDAFYCETTSHDRNGELCFVVVVCRCWANPANPSQVSRSDRSPATSCLCMCGKPVDFLTVEDVETRWQYSVMVLDF